MIRLVSAIASLCLLVACSAASTPTMVVTKLSSLEVVAGEQITVTCSAENEMGEIFDEVITTFAVEPSDALVVDTDAGTIATRVVGTHVVTCSAAEVPLAELSSATFTVVPGAADRITTLLEKDTIEVFETSAVTCVTRDALDNIIEAVDSVIEAPEEVLIAEGLASSETVGSYDITCRLAEVDTSVVVEGAELTVTAGQPATLELGVTPELVVYGVDQVVDFYYVVRDEHGNQILGLDATLDVPPVDVVEVDLDDLKYRLTAEGVYDFTLTLAEPHDALTASQTLIVDVTPPDIVITYPERGTTIKGQGDFITVEGYVTDSFSDIQTFEIDGVPVALDEEGNFSTFVLPNWGVNVIKAFATDLAGNSAKLSPTYAYSSSYLSYEDATVQDVVTEDAVELLLGQEFLDDGDHDQTQIDDLATLMEVLLSELSIADLLADLNGFPILNLPINVFDLDIGILQIEVGGYVDAFVEIVDPTDIGPSMVTIDSRLGGIDSAIEFGNAEEEGLVVATDITLDFNIGLTISSFLGTWNPNLTTQVVVESDVSIDSLLLATKIDIQKVPEQELYVDLVQLDSDVIGLEIDPIDDLVLGFTVDLDVPLIPSFDLDFALSQLFNLPDLTDQLLDPITSDFLPLIIDLINPIIENFADDILKQLLLAFNLETTLPIPDLLGTGADPIELDLATRLSRVDFTDEGGQIGLAMGLYADGDTEQQNLGAIQRDGCLVEDTEVFTYGWDRSAGAAIKTDVINAGLYSAWYSGALDLPIDLSALADAGGGLPIPLDDVSLNLTWLMPPVVSDCGGKGIIQAEVGDLFVQLQGNLLGSEVNGLMFIDAAVSIFFGASAQGLSITVGDFAFLEAEVIQISEIAGGIIDLKDLLENQLYGLLSGLIVGQSFGPLQLPPVALGDVVPGLPAEAVFELGNLSITKDTGYIVLGGDLL